MCGPKFIFTKEFEVGKKRDRNMTNRYHHNNLKPLIKMSPPSTKTKPIAQTIPSAFLTTL
jgi:hypothetical protein